MIGGHATAKVPRPDEAREGSLREMEEEKKRRKEGWQRFPCLRPGTPTHISEERSHYPKVRTQAKREEAARKIMAAIWIGRVRCGLRTAKNNSFKIVKTTFPESTPGEGNGKLLF